MQTTTYPTLLFAILIVLGSIHFSYAVSVESPPDSHPDVDIPVYHDGYQIEEAVNPDTQTKTVSYRVQLKPPAFEIIEFYDAYFNGAGWISSFEICQRHWDQAAGSSSSKELQTTQMYASWEKPEMDLKFVLWLKHETTDSQPPHVVTVEGRLQRKSGVAGSN